MTATTQALVNQNKVLLVSHTEAEQLRSNPDTVMPRVGLGITLGKPRVEPHSGIRTTHHRHVC